MGAGPQETGLPAAAASLPQPDPQAVQEVSRRIQLLIQAGKHPEWLFLCGTSTGTVTFVVEQKPVMLLFTTWHAARDYLRATSVPGEVRQLKFDAVPQVSPGWIAAGAERFILNRCPRCNIAVIGSFHGLTAEAFFTNWATVQATRWFMGERKVRELLRLQGNAATQPQARAALEHIRDHVDCSVPYVHELIAFHARMAQDQATIALCMERLKEFGPRFADWETRWQMPSLPRSLAEAMVGLAQSFGIEMKPPAQPAAPPSPAS